MPPTGKRGKFSCNEYLTKDGCLNALAKSFAVIDHLNKFNKVSDFWSWYEENIKEVKVVQNDIITVGQAIEKVKENYLKGEHNGISRSHPEFLTNSLGNFDRQYGLTYNKMLKLNLGDKSLNAELLIEFLESNYSELQTKKTKGFKTHYNNCQKLLIDSRLNDEIDKLKNHFGKIKVVPQLEMQEFSIQEFLELRKIVLENAHNEIEYNARIKVFNTLSINLIYAIVLMNFGQLKILIHLLLSTIKLIPPLAIRKIKRKSFFLKIIIQLRIVKASCIKLQLKPAIARSYLMYILNFLTFLKI